MINLGRCLVYLLSRNDRVALPGLGIFRRIDKPGYFDGVKQVFVAPESHIEFSPDSKKSEFEELIPEYIAAQKQIDRIEAETLYSDALAKWTTLLSQEGRIELQGIGVLQQLRGGKLEFITESPGSFGKKLPPVDELQVLEPEAAVSDTSGSELLVEEAAIEEEYEQVDEERKGGFWRNFLLIVVFLTLAIASLTYFRPDWVAQGREYWGNIQQELPVWLGGKQQAVQPAKPTPEVALTSPAVTPDTLQSQQDSLGLALQEEIEVAGTQEPLEAAPTESFEIIVGSFTSMEQANQFVADMKAKGIEVWAIESRMPGNRKKVSCASFPTQAEAYRALREVQRTIEPGAWVARVVR